MKLTHKAINDIEEEFQRQNKLHSEGHFNHLIEDPKLSDLGRIAIIQEEVGECTSCVLEDSGIVNTKCNHDLRAELIQVAACALRWVMYIDGNSFVAIEDLAKILYEIEVWEIPWDECNQTPWLNKAKSFMTTYNIERASAPKKNAKI